jgi:hypothetical protein
MSMLQNFTSNNYSYAFSTERDVLTWVIRNMPIPNVATSDLTRLQKAVRVYLQTAQNCQETGFSRETLDKLKILHWRIDVEVLQLYKLPRHLEFQLLYLFSGSKRPGVPFEQFEYFPKEFNEPLTLRGLLAITADWEQTNERRTQLIFKKVKKNITAEEKLELDELQRLADCRINLLTPFPIEKLEAVKEDLKRRGVWEEN